MYHIFLSILRQGLLRFFPGSGYNKQYCYEHMIVRVIQMTNPPASFRPQEVRAPKTPVPFFTKHNSPCRRQLNKKATKKEEKGQFLVLPSLTESVLLCFEQTLHCMSLGVYSHEYWVLAHLRDSNEHDLCTRLPSNTCANKYNFYICKFIFFRDKIHCRKCSKMCVHVWCTAIRLPCGKIIMWCLLLR